MRITLIADTFPPLRTSGAVQLRDLSREFVRQGHSLRVLLPSADQQEPWRIEKSDGAIVIRLKAPKTKDIGYVQRTLAELAMPYVMLWNLRKSPIAFEDCDALVWYSPSIFHGPLVSALKKSSRCKSYLIVRDVFPDWAVEMGLMRRGIHYRFFDWIARYQYSLADVIGVQTQGNLKYFDLWIEQLNRKLEVLPNWLDKKVQKRCSIRIDQTALVGRKVLVYAGNMGIAQGMGILLDLANCLIFRKDVGFLFVGRGSNVTQLRDSVQSRQLENTVFFDEIDPDEISDLFTQCAAGIVMLDHRHKSHNIPGKFLTYMQNGLPVLANINAGNDLAKMIKNEHVGQVSESNQLADLLQMTLKLLDQIDNDLNLPKRCKALFEREFAVESTVKQIVEALSIDDKKLS